LAAVNSALTRCFMVSSRLIGVNGIELGQAACMISTAFVVASLIRVQ
jgi:hypothetical protein